MNQRFLWIEAVNFDATIYDTNDLSVIRAGSLILGDLGDVAQGALETLAQAREGLGFDLEFAGASQARFRLTGDGDDCDAALAAVQAALSRGVWAHMSIVAGLGDTPEQAIAGALSRRFRTWTMPAWQERPSDTFDALDKVRPATKKDGLKGLLSESTSARLNQGRRRRETFLTERAGERLTQAGLRDRDDGDPGALKLCASFEDMVLGRGGKTCTSPESALGKICLLHLDGDGFGKAARAAEKAGRLREFSDRLETTMEAGLARIIDAAVDSEALEAPEGARRLRLEILVWGGDDITLALPATRLLPTLTAFHAAIDGLEFDGAPLGFTGGAIIANYKSPVRKLVALAETAVHTLKAGDARGCFTVDVFESADVPESDLAGLRANIFGEEARAPGAFAFRLSEASALIDSLRKWKGGAGDAFPSRSKTFDLLARDGGAADDETIDTLLLDYHERLGGAMQEGGRFLPPGPMGRSRMLELKLGMMLWDYVGPDLPGDAVEAAA
ncbi:Cas10/Cmr2 second palm domain-containing protein [Rhodovulum sp. DZ06]|uniref:Cas10/Cmr2 second palm domain-containing protein n=1 Tax=Rhodovulum sp. DZ06 TaxID=3425126 RepID=UPI003D327E95